MTKEEAAKNFVRTIMSDSCTFFDECVRCFLSGVNYARPIEFLKWATDAGWEQDWSKTTWTTWGEDWLTDDKLYEKFLNVTTMKLTPQKLIELGFTEIDSNFHFKILVLYSGHDEFWYWENEENIKIETETDLIKLLLKLL